MPRKKTVITVKLKRNYFFTIIFSGALILALSLAFISFKLYSDSSKNNKYGEILPSQSTLSTDQTGNKILLEKVARHILLPEGSPNIITVTNVETLKKDQPFFAKAQDGHKLLIYNNKVIIYDPQKDLIVDIAYIKPTGIPPGQP